MQEPVLKKQKLNDRDQGDPDDLDGGDGKIVKLTLDNLQELYAPNIPIMESWLKTSSSCKGIPSLAYLSALSWAGSQTLRNGHHTYTVRKNMPSELITYLRMAIPTDYGKSLCVIHNHTKLNIMLHKERKDGANNSNTYVYQWKVQFFEGFGYRHGNINMVTWVLHAPILSNHLYSHKMVYSQKFSCQGQDKIKTYIAGLPVIGICPFVQNYVLKKQYPRTASVMNKTLMWPSPKPRTLLDWGAPPFAKQMMKTVWKRRYACCDFKTIDMIVGDCIRHIKELGLFCVKPTVTKHQVRNALLWLIQNKCVHIKKPRKNTYVGTVEYNKVSAEEYTTSHPELSTQAFGEVIREHFQRWVYDIKDSIPKHTPYGLCDLSKGLPEYNRNILLALLKHLIDHGGYTGPLHPVPTPIDSTHTAMGAYARGLAHGYI